jgi:hypothetical protein
MEKDRNEDGHEQGHDPALLTRRSFAPAYILLTSIVSAEFHRIEQDDMRER